MSRRLTDDRGQVLVIVAAAMVVLLGIAALAIDLGFGWMMRRQAQNAVDPAAIAAARWIDDTSGSSINPTEAWDSACFYAHQNGYFGGPTSTADCVPANDPLESTLDVNFPPDASAGQWAGTNGMVQVVITSERETFFSRIFGADRVKVSEQAVAARQRGNTNTHSLIALNPKDCSTGNVHGTGSVRIYAAPGYTGDGGYVQVNSDCQANATDNACGPGQGALKIDGTAVLEATKINVHGSCQSGSAPVGTLDEAAAQIGDPLAGLVPPPIDPSLDGGKCGVTSLPTRADDTNRMSCGSSKMPWKFSANADCPGMATTGGFKCVVLFPGVYYGGWEINTKIHVRLNPGIYTIAGGGITIKSSGELDSIQSASGAPAPVLIINTDNPIGSGCPANNDPECQGDLQLGTASSKLKIAGLLPDQPCPPATTSGGCPFGRLVIWHVADGSSGYDGEIGIEGGAELFISGTIYAPTAFVDIEGNAGTNCGSGLETQKASVQVIAWEWRIGGTGQLCMPYDPSLLYKLTQQGLVY